MLEILTEKWMTIVLAGGLLVVILLSIGLQRGEKKILVAAGVIFALTCALVVVERLIVTRREQVQSSLNGIERAVNRHDLDSLLTYIHSSANDIRDDARRYYGYYDVQEANIKPMRKYVVLSEDEVQVEFIVVLTGGASGSTARSGPIAVQANFKKEDGTWKVIKYRWDSVEKVFTNKGFGEDVDIPGEGY